jgi:membrane-bound serine protease (ClpP class)
VWDNAGGVPGRLVGVPTSLPSFHRRPEEVAMGTGRARWPRSAILGLWLAAWAGATIALTPGAAGQGAGRTILVTSVRGPITPIIADHLSESLARAVADGHHALLVELDTPGGLDTSMREIVQAFLGAQVPVIVYVAPPGARAGSAGTFITMAAHVAAMAPGTAIGAATPVDLEGGQTSQKVVRDAAAYAESIARLRDRDVTFATQAVTEGRSEPAEVAVAIGAVDLIAENRVKLLRAIDGRTVRIDAGTDVTLRTAGAVPVDHQLGLFRRILQWLADPNLAFLFLSLGTLAVLYEVANPGIGGGAVVGVILIVLALFALSVLPVNAVGAILLVLGFILFVAELFVPGIGVLAAGGTAAVLLGGLFLFRGQFGVDPVVLVPTGVLLGGGTVLLARVAWRSRTAPTVSGTGAIVGSTGKVQVAEGATAQVKVQGVWWGARSAHGPLSPGQRVRVVGMDGLELAVEPLDEEEVIEG